jgi:hypothetical protein
MVCPYAIILEFIPFVRITFHYGGTNPFNIFLKAFDKGEHG